MSNEIVSKNQIVDAELPGSQARHDWNREHCPDDLRSIENDRFHPHERLAENMIVIPNRCRIGCCNGDIKQYRCHRSHEGAAADQSAK